MTRKTGLWLLWFSFIAYAFFLAPPNQPETPEVLKNLITGDWQGINPLVVAIFNLLGIVPLIYSCLLLIDGTEQKIPASPFVLGSFGVGAFSLLPYLALREPNQTFTGKKSTVLRVLDSRWMGVAITLGTLGFLGYGLLGGNWSDFIEQFQTSRFVNVMSLDFCLLCLLFPTLLKDDMARRGIKNPQVFWAVSLIPLLGWVVYLCLRPPLPETSAGVASSQQQPAKTS